MPYDCTCLLVRYRDGAWCRLTAVIGPRQTAGEHVLRSLQELKAGHRSGSRLRVSCFDRGPSKLVDLLPRAWFSKASKAQACNMISHGCASWLVVILGSVR